MYKAKALKYVITRLPLSDSILLEASVVEDEPIKDDIEVEAIPNKSETLEKQILPPTKEKVEA